MITSFLEYLVQPENFLFLFVLLFGIRFVLFSTLEYFFVAHPFNQIRVIASDLAAMFLYLILMYPLAHYMSNAVGIQGTFLFSYLGELPLFIRIILYFIVADFIHYLLHMLMHTRFLWRIHMWHHSFTHMSWIAGIRATVFDTALINLAFIFAWPLLGDVSTWIQLLLLLTGLLINDWMHLNVRFHIPFLEKIIIMPRYHHIHHSTDEKHYTKNLAAIFPIWDKIFGTYVDPDTVEGKLTFGLTEKRPRWRIILGL